MDVRNFIHRASAVILPTYREGVPRTLLEALCIGRPVITTDVPGCREVVDHGENGMLIPSHDSRAVAKAMEEVYNIDPGIRQRMGEKSRELAERKFSTRVVNEQYLAVLKQILEKTQ